MTEDNYSPRALGAMVRDIMADEGMTLDDAVEAAHTRVRSALDSWWDGIGQWVIREAERDLLRRPDATVRGPRHSNPHAARPKSWRERYQSDPSLVMDMEFPVGASGVRRRIGDLTRSDVYAIKEFYVGAANTMLFRGEYWGRIGDAMSEDETIEQAHAAGKIESAHMAFLGERGRIDAEPMQGLTAGEKEDAA